MCANRFRLKPKKSKKDNLAARLQFTNHLDDAIRSGRLIGKVHKAGDWLALLSEEEFNTLYSAVKNWVQRMNSDDSVYAEPCLDADADLLALTLHLKSLEDGKPLEHSEKEIIVLFHQFLFIVFVEFLCRNGHAELSRTISFDEDYLNKLSIQLGEQIEFEIGSKIRGQGKVQPVR
jgi:hypothetical protein